MPQGTLYTKHLTRVKVVGCSEMHAQNPPLSELESGPIPSSESSKLSVMQRTRWTMFEHQGQER